MAFGLVEKVCAKTCDGEGKKLRLTGLWFIASKYAVALHYSTRKRHFVSVGGARDDALRRVDEATFSYAFPNNTPDLDSMKRLWTHELLRVLLDRELSNETRQRLLDVRLFSLL